MSERLLRIEDVSEQTGVPVNTLRYWREQSKRKGVPKVGPQGVRLGRRVVYRQSDVDTWLAQAFAEVDHGADGRALRAV